MCNEVRMPRTEKRYQNVGRIKTLLTVNFENSDEVLESIQPMLQSCRLKQELIKLAKGILVTVEEDDALNGALEILTRVLKCVNQRNETSDDVIFFLKTFGSFFSDLEVNQQIILYKVLGEQINAKLYEQTQNCIKMENVDIATLMKSSAKDIYENVDIRLKVFIEEAVNTSYTEKFGSDVAKTKKTSFCHNIVEHFLKARNLRFVSLSGLSLLTLVYIFSGRSIQTCNMFAATGAKGSHKLVTKFVLPNSKETSYKECKDGVTVFYSFDSIQKLFRVWRLYGSGQDKSLAKVAPYIIHCYPDGLISSNVQYVLRHSPMKWLYKFEIEHCDNFFIEKMDNTIIEKLMQLDDDDLNIILGRWDLTIDLAIAAVKKETIEGNDTVDKIMEAQKKIEEKNFKVCVDGHINEKPRANQIYCKICKKLLVDNKNNLDEIDDDSDNMSDGDYKRLKIMENDGGPIEVLLTDIDTDTKSKLFPQMRNIFNENKAIYESQGITYVKPNKFIRVKLVFDEIQRITNTKENHTTLLKIENENKITTEVSQVNNVRSWIVVTLDGSPHKIAIDVIKHCYQCEECGKDFTVNTDVMKHFKKHGHKLYWKKYANLILKIGGLHAEMNMLRSFVSLNWKILYSFVCKSIGFLSPKAQLLQLKVQDMHKSTDTFYTSRDAIVKEVVKLFIQHADENTIEATSETFELWLENDVKNPNILLAMNIQKYFGTSLWLYHAGQRANYFKLYRAAMRVFSGLFHINGNLHYSVIEMFDDYLMTSLEVKNNELFEYLTSRLCTNLNGEKFCAQSHDARHEESNKQAQNMFPGKDLEELELAFTIVDDVYKLRSKVFAENGLTDRTGEVRLVSPDYEKNTVIMRCYLRKSEYFEEPLGEFTMVSQPIRLILVEWFYAKRNLGRLLFFIFLRSSSIFFNVVFLVGSK